mmetsp:Transcript_17281/g.25709  ORF Transcript_17281/g.25709 Transcript_17281/m.25709 type:complete len:319 (+) Transcript_17281:486-1442(+)
MYDQYGEQAFDGENGPQNWQGVDPEEILRHFGFGGSGGFGFEDLFGQRQGGGPRGQQAMRGEHIQLSLPLTFFEAVHGATKEVVYSARSQCDPCGGSGLAPGKSRVKCKNCDGSGHSVHTQGFFQMMETCRHCEGTGSVIEDPCSTCSGAGYRRERKRVQITVPEGADNGQNLRVSGRGHAGEHGGPPGHLFIELSVSKDDVFKRDGVDVHLDVPITISQAILGSSVRVPTLNGQVDVKVPPGTQPDEVRVLRNKGVKKVNSSIRGSQYLHFKVKVPKTITSQQRELMEQFSKEDALPPPSTWEKVINFVKKKFPGAK